MKILMIEDDSITRYAITTMVSERGHVFESTGNYTQAMTKLRSSEYDLIILDLELIENDGNITNGFQIIKDSHSEIPILVHTSKQRKRSDLDSSSFNVIGWLTKPANIQDFILHIRMIDH